MDLLVVPPFLVLSLSFFSPASQTTPDFLHGTGSFAVPGLLALNAFIVLRDPWCQYSSICGSGAGGA